MKSRRFIALSFDASPQRIRICKLRQAADVSVGSILTEMGFSTTSAFPPKATELRTWWDGSSCPQQTTLTEIELANSFSAANAGPPTIPPEARQMPGTI